MYKKKIKHFSKTIELKSKLLKLYFDNKIDFLRKKNMVFYIKKLNAFLSITVVILAGINQKLFA